MSEPQEITPVAPPPEPVNEFDLQAFWIQYKTTVIGCIIAVVAFLVAYGAYEWRKKHRVEGSTAAFAGATTPEALQKVTSEWSGTPAGSTARLVLGETLRNEKKYDESEKVLQQFIKDDPKHQLISGALTSLAITQEAAGKVDQAISTYQQVATSHKDSPHAEPALIAQARIFKAQKRDDEASKTLDTFDQQFPQSPWMFDARRMRKDLKPRTPDIEGVSSAPVKVEPTVTEVKVDPATSATGTPASVPATTDAVPAALGVPKIPPAETQPQTVSTPPLSVDSIPAQKDSKGSKPEATKGKKSTEKKSSSSKEKKK